MPQANKSLMLKESIFFANVKMNTFQLQQVLYGGKTAEPTANDAKPEPTPSPKDVPGTSTIASYEVVDYTKDSSFPIYKPRISRKTMSKFEFDGAITTLAEYIDNIPSIRDYIDGDINDSININSLINPAEFTYRLVMNHKLDCIIVRYNGLEKVSFSELKINPIWIRQIDEHFATKNASMKKELYDAIADKD